MNEYAGKKAVVTGGTHGLGPAMVSVSSTPNRGWAIGAAGCGAAVQTAFKPPSRAKEPSGASWPPGSSLRPPLARSE
jgi:NAD(P)-dependent dehydrogenase (short-subunit alcohol dehydrogenase family)